LDCQETLANSTRRGIRKGSSPLERIINIFSLEFQRRKVKRRMKHLPVSQKMLPRHMKKEKRSLLFSFEAQKGSSER